MYERRLGERTLTFGVSGYLYRSAVLFYDDQTETFWSQMTARAVVGPLTGKRLGWYPSEVTTWKDWRARHPATTVLRPPHPIEAYRRTNRGYRRYRARDALNFPIGPDPVDPRFPAKSSVSIVVRGGMARCYPHARLKEGDNRDGDLVVRKRGTSVRVFTRGGKEIPAMSAFWFAWCVFYPDGTVYGDEEGAPDQR